MRTHGLNSTYTAGCRCEDCTVARRDYQRGYRFRGATQEATYQLPVGKAPGAWVDQARCKGMDVEVFFPKVGGGGIPEAVLVCHDCPVRVPCLEYALSENITEGVWGGKTGRERKAIRRKWRAAS